MKMISEIHFIEARSPGAHVFSRFPIPRLGTVLLGTILRNRGYKTKVFIEDVAKPDWEAIEKADAVGISTITSTAIRAYKLADGFRARGKTVIMGGPHVTFLPEEALEHSDYVVRGEGEDTLPELLDALNSGTPLDGIKGLSFVTPAGIVHNPQRDFISDLDQAPMPDFSLVHGWGSRSVVPIATSRGCPFDCRFCSVIHMFGRKYRFKGTDRVMEELRAVRDPNTHIFFIDDNFTADRKRTKALLTRIISEGLKLDWSAQVRTDAADDPDLLRLMKKAGCSRVFVGFESVNPRTLELYRKKQKLEDVTRAIKNLKSHGIRIHGMFVVGSDTDNVETVRETEVFARKTGIDSVQFLMLTPLPGTPVYDDLKAEGRLLHTDWSKYDAHHAVFRPMSMTPSELQRETFKAMAKFYSWRTILRHMATLDFYYGMVCMYGKHAVRKARADGERYLAEIEGGLKIPTV